MAMLWLRISKGRVEKLMGASESLQRYSGEQKKAISAKAKVL